MAGRVLVLIAAALLATAAPARADVEWTAPPACPGREALLARVAAELGRPVEAAAVDVSGRVASAGRLWRLELVVGGGTRVLEARSCRELVATAALVIAMAIDAGAQTAPDAAGHREIEMPADGPVLVPTYRREADAEAPPARGLSLVESAAGSRPTPPRSDLEVRVRAAFGGDSGGLPGLASGLGAGIEAGLGAWSLDLAAHRWFRQRAFSQPEQGAALDLMTVSFAACRQLAGDDRTPADAAGPGRWRFTACAGAELDALGARPFGFDAAAPAQTLFGGGLAAGVAVARHVAGPVWLRLDANASALLVRVGYREGDPERPDMLGPSVHRMDWLLARGFVSAEVRVP